MTASGNVVRGAFELPKLPGNSFQDEMSRKSFHKKQVMQPLLGPKAQVVGRVPVDFEAVPIKKQVAVAAPAPPEVEPDKQVLRFYGYFKEGVSESKFENERVRKVVINHFLVDATTSVMEPTEDNSGMPQGQILKRHRISKEAGEVGVYTCADFDIGAIVTFYGRCYRICGCDDYTRRWYEEHGQDMDEPIPYPRDSYRDHRAAKPKKEVDPEDRNLKAVMECQFSGKRSRLSPGELRAAKQFLKMDGKVLKFQAHWDDTGKLYGDERKLIVYYFLADDTLEVTEDYAVNAGRDPFPSFFRRKKCVKPAGKFENLNASLRFAAPEQQYYTDADLYVGATINVFGRQIQLTSCDKFTEDYLRQVHARASTPITVGKAAQPKPPVAKPQPPPYNGFGDEDDSLGSWKNLVLKPPRKDVKKLLENRAQMLKYSMKMVSGDPANDVRRFVLTYYLADDTVSIFEPPQRNSGIIGGKFLQRTKVKHSNTGQPLKAEDLYIGSAVEIHNHKFAVYASDEKSLTLMEQQHARFAKSKGTAMMAKVRAMLMSSQTALHREMLALYPLAEGAAIDYIKFTEILNQRGLDVSEHEVLTVLRYIDYDADRDRSVTYEELLGVLFPAHFGFAPASVDQPWQQIYKEYTSEDEIERIMAEADTTQYHSDVERTAAAAARVLLDKYENHQRTLTAAIKSEACKAVDSKVGEGELCKVLAKLNMDSAVAAAGQALLAKQLLGGGRVEVADLMTKMFRHAQLKAVADGKL